MKSYMKATHNNKRKKSGIVIELNKKSEGGVNVKKKSKQVMKFPNGLKNVMSLLSED